MLDRAGVTGEVAEHAEGAVAENIACRGIDGGEHGEAGAAAALQPDAAEVDAGFDLRPDREGLADRLIVDRGDAGEVSLGGVDDLKARLRHAPFPDLP